MRKAQKQAEGEIVDILTRLSRDTGADILSTNLNAMQYQDGDGRRTLITDFKITLGLE